MSKAYLNDVATALPATPCHHLFEDFARRLITGRQRVLLERMLKRSGIGERYSVLAADSAGGSDALDQEGFYTYGAFPSTARRMARYQEAAPKLAEEAVLDLKSCDLAQVTHLLFCTCTGFSAPGIDLHLVRTLGLSGSVKRTVIGFMGCYAGVTALRNAAEIVAGDPSACVLIVTVELCTLHLQETDDLETVLSMALFGDGAAAALVTSEARGLALDRFDTVLLQEARDLITWDIGDQGFDMVLSGQVPSALKKAMPILADGVLSDHSAIDLWAVHPGGRTILDAVQTGLHVPEEKMRHARGVLHDAGNLSSSTVLFVLQRLLREKAPRGALGAGMAFGPGLTAETFRFSAC